MRMSELWVDSAMGKTLEDRQVLWHDRLCGQVGHFGCISSVSLNTKFSQHYPQPVVDTVRVHFI